MNFYYVNSKGIRLDFSDYPYLFQEGTLLDYAWTYDTQEGKRNKIKNVHHGIGEREFQLALVPDFNLSFDERKVELLRAANHVYEVFDTDVNRNVDGRLYTDTGFYLPCRIMASTKSEWCTGLPFMFQKFTVVSAENMWIKEYTYSFSAGETEQEFTGFDYPYDFAYDYDLVMHRCAVTSPAAFDSDFRLEIFGPVIYPIIRINDHAYGVDVTVEEGEYLTIDSKARKIWLTRRNGVTMNCFDLRDRDSDVFAKIPAQSQNVHFDAAMKFNLVLYDQRSEPAWT